MTVRRLVVPTLLVLAAVPRLIGLGQPGQLIFDEAHYARDACTYVSSDGCGIDHEANFEHPPLGKWLIAAGILMFGNDGLGWRIMPALAGIASVVLLYLLGLQVSGSLRIAGLAAGLLAVDPLHFVQSRIAMLDIFVLAFGLACLLCAYRNRESASLWWILGAGAAGGAAVACKWSGIVFLVIALVLMGRRTNNRKTLMLPVAVAALVYCLSFVGRVDGIDEFFARQADMWSFHSGLDYQHPYASGPWSWLLLRRPVAYFFGTLTDGRYEEVLAVGNPFMWWPALAAIGYGAWAWIKGRAEPVVRLAVVGFFATFGLWIVFSPFRSATFLFYMTPVVPFMYLALASVAVRARWAQLAAAAMAVAFFVFLFPVTTAAPISPAGWHVRLLFEDCDSPGRTPEEIATPLVHATPGGGSPPDGWCWI